MLGEASVNQPLCPRDEARAPESVEAFYLQQARGEVFGVLRQVCEIWQDVETLSFIGFTIEFRATTRFMVQENYVKLQDAHAELVASITTNMLRHRLGSQLWHLASWPGLLALLLQIVYR